jgi:acyl-coenzyme A thioesterase PaaI-like protein
MDIGEHGTCSRIGGMNPEYLPDELDSGELARLEKAYEPFTRALRELVDAGIRSTVDVEEIERARVEIEQIAARLCARQIPGAFGGRVSPDGGVRMWGNAVIGLRNAAAPGLVVHPDPDTPGRVFSDFELGAAYEGPPGLVHGGVSALILDHVLGSANSAARKPGMTGTLTLRYRRGTPLGRLRAEAWFERVDGVKSYARGHILGPEGVTVEADGVFILPRWARPEAGPVAFE